MLHIHRADRADALLDSLGAILRAPLPDPFAPELIAVPTRGMERWLTQRLAGSLGTSPDQSDGVCANVDFPSPRRLVGDAVAAASGIDPDRDPWQPERALWPLLEVLDGCLREPWLRGLAAHLGAYADLPDATRADRRLPAVRHLAELFDRYALHRPAMLEAWRDGADTDGAGRPLPADAIWQAALWRALRARIAVPGPAERVDAACARLRDTPSAVALPARLALFGLTRLPAGLLHVLRALAHHRDIHLFLLHPSPALWERIAAAATQPRSLRRAADPTADLPRNRLLASWAQDTRETQLVLTATDGPVEHHLHNPARQAPDTLLRLIQADVRGDRRPPGAPLAGLDEQRPPLRPADRSLQVHACHGRARQVEVLRDAILHELADDPTLEPREIIVMCPDIETFAPLIAATFGAGARTADDEAPPADGHPADLRVRLADRALLQTNPVLAVVARLLELARLRVTASQVLDLADREPVRRRFRFDDEDVTRVAAWVAASGVRWGLDAAHRAPFKLERVATGTWRAGLDRVLAGVAMTEDGQRCFADVLPLDDVPSGAIDLAGRFAELVDRLAAALDGLRPTQPLREWAAALAAAADMLTDGEVWQRAELQRLLDDILDEAGPTPTPITLGELRALLAPRLAGRPTRASFATGHLTICTLHPMRSVPHRVVCLLGLDDGVFPRQAPRDGDDLMLDDPRVGERDPSAEDRQLLLDALLAAQDRLIITYTGSDERTNAPRPAAVPVGELLDVVAATVLGDVLVRHPLQPFDPRNFTGERIWSFDSVMLAGARALGRPRAQPGPFLAHRLAAAPATHIELDQLVRFVAHPVRAFLRQRLGIRLSTGSQEVADGLSIELDGLARWAIGQRLLEALLAGVDGRTAIVAEIARGGLPPGVLGRPVVQEVFPIARELVATAAALAGGPAESLDVRVALAEGRTLHGTVSGVRGDVLLAVTYSRLAPKHRLAAWVRLLAASAAHPERALCAASVGRGGVARVAPLGGGAAVEHLTGLVELYDRGMREPLPLYCATSAAWAAGGRDPEGAARRAWTTTYDFEREDRDLEHQLVLGGVRSFDDLPPLDVYARKLWDGLLEREQT